MEKEGKTQEENYMRILRGAETPFIIKLKLNINV